MNYRLLHCADLHLDSPLRGLSAAADAPADLLRTASRRAFENLIDLAIAEAVAVVLIAGDIFDGDWKDWHTGQFFVRGLARLAQAGIHVVAISGNHDAASEISRKLESAWPKQARLLDHRKPQTVDFPALDLSIHGRSFATRAVLDNIAKDYPRPVPGHLNIGLLHTALEGREGHEPYAPCTLQQLRDFGYDYWALGHVHGRAELSRDPWIVFPGNLQARHINEAGEKGATLMTVEDRRIVAVQHRVLDVVRWLRLSVDVSGCVDLDAVEAVWLESVRDAARAAGDRFIAARASFVGASPAHAALLSDPIGNQDRLRNVALTALPPGALWLERIELATTPPGGAAIADPEAAPLLHLLGDLGGEAQLAALAAWSTELLNKAPGLREALPADHPAVALAAGALPAALLDQARALLRARLAGG